MKAIIAIALAAALFLYGAPASADEPGQEELNKSTVYNLDESRPDVRD